MPVIKTVRTTAFRLAPEHFGTVHAYRPGPRFARAWDRLEALWRERGNVGEFRSLPYRGLSVALRVISGDFVALQRRVEQERAFVLSRQLIELDRLEMAVGAWEVHALGLEDRPISGLLDDLTIEQVDVARLVRRRSGLCPTLDGGRWPWDVAVWEIAHRFAQKRLMTDAGPVSLQLDSDAALLTWTHTVPARAETAGAAMHKITPTLITIPSIEAPVVSLQSSLVRLAPTWRETGGPRFAWAELGPDMPILRAAVRARKGENGWCTVWGDRAAQVLQGAALQPLPDTSSEPTFAGALRTGYAKQPSRHPIGRGVGTWFHECVAHHAREVLGRSAEPVTLTATRAAWPTRERLAPRAPLSGHAGDVAPAFRLLIVYANSDVRRRLRDALIHILRDRAPGADGEWIKDVERPLRELPDGETLRAGPIEVKFVCPPGAERQLLQRTRSENIVAWLDEWMGNAVEHRGVAALIETDEAARDGQDDLDDPKHLLRAAFASRGIVTQFVTKSSAASERKSSAVRVVQFDDHAAANAISDLMRSAGFFLRPFPPFELEPGTLVVGVYGARVTNRTTRKNKAGYLVNVVAASTGTREAWGYVKGQGWRALGEATARFLGTDHDHDVESAKRLVETAVEQLRLTFSGRRILLLFDAFGCRRFWGCLADKSEGRPEAWMAAGGKAVVRIRAVAGEVPRPAGTGSWTNGFCPAKHTGFRPMVVHGVDGTGPHFVLSGSAVMSQGFRARKSTRLVATDRALREDWHALGTTEILVLDPGPWSVTQVAEQVAMMCRIVPTWDRVLRWPSPLHLARAVVRDHPHRYFPDVDAESEESEDIKPLRFDNV